MTVLLTIHPISPTTVNFVNYVNFVNFDIDTEILRGVAAFLKIKIQLEWGPGSNINFGRGSRFFNLKIYLAWGG